MLMLSVYGCVCLFECVSACIRGMESVCNKYTEYLFVDELLYDSFVLFLKGFKFVICLEIKFYRFFSKVHIAI